MHWGMGHPGGCERISQGRWIPECLHAGESKTPAELVLWAGQEAPACRTPGRTHPGTWRETGCTSGLAGTLHLSGVRGHLADGVGVSFTEDTFWMPKTETGLGMWGLPGTRHPFQGQRGGSPEGERRERRESGPPAAQLPSGSRENQPQEALGRRVHSCHSGWPGPLGRTAPRHLPQTARSAPGRPSCCPGLGLQRQPTSDMTPGSSPGCCRVPAHLGPSGRGAG